MIDKTGKILLDKYEFINNNEDDIITAIISNEAIGENTFDLKIVINDSDILYTIRAHPYQKMSEIRYIIENKIDNKHNIFSFHSTNYWDIHRDHMHRQTLKFMLLNESNILYAYTTDYEKIREKISNRINNIGYNNEIPRYFIYGGYNYWQKALEKL